MQDFSLINLGRCDNPDAFNKAEKDLNYFLTSLAEEVGELCGAHHKMERGFNERERKKTIKRLVEMAKNQNKSFKVDPKDWDEATLQEHWRLQKLSAIKDEIADVFIMLNLIASKSGVNWKEAVLEKFNRVTEECNYPDSYKIQSTTQI